jgi:hypothetical protein
MITSTAASARGFQSPETDLFRATPGTAQLAVIAAHPARAAAQSAAPARVTAPAAGAATTTRRAATTRASTSGYAKASGAAAKPTTAKTTTPKKSTSTAASTKKTTATKTPADLAFLDDPRLSTDEKLFRFLCYVTAKTDAKIEQKMKELGAATASGASASGGTKSSGGTTSTGGAPAPTPKKKSLFGSIVKTVFPVAAFSLDLVKSNKGVQSLVKTVSGPVLAAAATALGAPELAPVLLKAGPSVADALIGIAKSLDLDGAPSPGGGSRSGGSGGSGGGSSGSTKGSTPSGAGAENPQVQMMELQRMVEKQKEMMSLVSNMLKGMHDMRMVAINNMGR